MLHSNPALSESMKKAPQKPLLKLTLYYVLTTTYSLHTVHYIISSKFNILTTNSVILKPLNDLNPNHQQDFKSPFFHTN